MNKLLCKDNNQEVSQKQIIQKIMYSKTNSAIITEQNNQLITDENGNRMRCLYFREKNDRTIHAVFLLNTGQHILKQFDNYIYVYRIEKILNTQLIGQCIMVYDISNNKTKYTKNNSYHKRFINSIKTLIKKNQNKLGAIYFDTLIHSKDKEKWIVECLKEFCINRENTKEYLLKRNKMYRKIYKELSRLTRSSPLTGRPIL